MIVVIGFSFGYLVVDHGRHSSSLYVELDPIKSASSEPRSSVSTYTYSIRQDVILDFGPMFTPHHLETEASAWKVGARI
jgi:hypothetical protein